MQLFVRTDRTLSLQTDPASTVAELKAAIERRAGVAQAEQRLIYGGRQLRDSASLQTCGLQPDSTLHLVLRLCGGKGGFGALLRAGARATVSQNTDACRDLSGRRMRHVNADKKLEEWQAEAQERELEKVALRHIKAEAKAAERTSRAEVDVDAVRQEQRSGLARIQETMSEVVATSQGVKRNVAPAAVPQDTKRARLTYFDGDSDTDESDAEDTPAAGAASAAAAPPEPAAAPAPAAPVMVPSGGHAAPSTGPAQARLGPDTSAAAAAAVDRQASVTSPRPKSGREASVASNAQEAQPVSSSSGASAATASVAASAGRANSPVAASGAQSAKSAPSAAATAAAPAAVPKLDLSQYPDAKALESLGIDALKVQLQAAGLKCGGNLSDRATRLFLLRDTPVAKLDRKHLAKPAKI